MTPAFTERNLYCVLLDFNLRWYQQIFNPIWIKPNLWAFSDFLKKMAFIYASDLALLNSYIPGNVCNKLDIIKKDLPEDFTVSMFCVLVCWLASFCKGSNLAETRQNCHAVSKFLAQLSKLIKP